MEVLGYVFLYLLAGFISAFLVVKLKIDGWQPEGMIVLFWPLVLFIGILLFAGELLTRIVYRMAGR